MPDSVKQKSKSSLRRTLFQMCGGFFFVLSVYNGIEPLQSSLNSDQGLGTTTVSVIYVSAVFSSLLIATPLINILGPKLGIIALFLTHTLYCIANFHPRWWTLVPASAAVGLLAAVGWGSQGIYMISLSRDYAAATRETTDTVMSFFTGIFFVFIGLTRPLGNFISSVVLKEVQHPYNVFHAKDLEITNDSGIRISYNKSLNPAHLQTFNESNSTSINFHYCGANHCPFEDSHSSLILQPNISLIYILMGIYLACNITGVAITATLPTMQKWRDGPKANAFGKLREMFRLFCDARLLLLIMPYLASGVVRAMHVGSYTQSFISCMLGTGMVGYAMMCDGLGYAIMSIISGRLNKYVPRIYHIIATATVNISIAILWLLWQPDHDSIWVYYILALVQGATNGVWKVQTMAITGIIFSSSLEAAYCQLMTWEPLGQAIVFGYSNYLCFRMKTYIFIGVVSAALVSFTVLDIKLKKNITKETYEEPHETELMNKESNS